MKLLAPGLLLLLPSPAAAHGLNEAWSSGATWTADPLILGPLYAVGLVYLLGANRLWRRAGFGRGTRGWQIASFWAGWTVLALALLSPLHWLSERLLSAHMIEHELIMAVAAPLLVLSRPLGVFLWAFPAPSRRSIAAAFAVPGLATFWLLLTEPAIATVLHSATIWIWHLPALFDAALANPWLHIAQHASFLATALLFWWAVLRVPRAQFGASAFHLFATMLAMTLLGALIALDPHPLYAAYRGEAAAFSLTELEDQQLAGVIMWVPGCAIYAGAALALLAQWIRRSQFRGSEASILRHEPVNW
jgi:putative membrane protein